MINEDDILVCGGLNFYSQGADVNGDCYNPCDDQNSGAFFGHHLP